MEIAAIAFVALVALFFAGPALIAVCLIAVSGFPRFTGLLKDFFFFTVDCWREMFTVIGEMWRGEHVD